VSGFNVETSGKVEQVKACITCKSRSDCAIFRFILSYPKVCEPPPYDIDWHCSDWERELDATK
jgi:hypothetical protein